MRKISIILGLVIVVAVAVTIFLATFNPNDYRAAIQTKLQKLTNREVSLGTMELGLFPLRIKVANLTIADDRQFSSRAFVQTRELSVSLKLWPLLRKSVQVDALVLKHPSVELIKNAQGVWNFASLSQSAAPSQSSSGEGELSVGRLGIEDGQMAITDLQNRKPRTVYDHINLELKDFAPRTPFNLEASVHLPGSGDQQVHLQGTGGPLVSAEPASTPFKGVLELKGVQVASLQKFLQSPGLADTDGMLTGRTNVATQNGSISADGQINIDKPRLRGIDVGFPVRADYNLTDDLPSDVLRIKKATIVLGPTSFRVTGTVNAKANPAQLDLNVKANELSIAEISKLAAAAGVATSPGAEVDGRLSLNLQARGAADKPTVQGTVSGHDLQISGKNIPKPVQIKTVNLAVSPTEIHTDNFNVTSGGTTAAVQFGIRQYTSDSPLLDATVRATQAGLMELLSMARAYGVTGLDNLSGGGTLSLDLHVVGPLKAAGSNQLTQSLNGIVKLNFENVRYAGVDISHQLSNLAGLPSAPKDQGFTNISKMTGDIMVKSGVAQTNNLQALLDIGNVGATGTGNLTSQELNLQLTAVLSKAVSQGLSTKGAGTANVGSYVNAALSNREGRLVIPANVTGTLQNPKFSPDLKRMAQMKLKGLIPTADNPLGSASSIIEGLLGPKSQPAKGKSQQQNPADQLLGIFTNKKK
jgi:uncharacterized protein involved in outer membrane biogenesis